MTTPASTADAFDVGAAVQVKCLFPVGHIRTPRYIMGHQGTVVHNLGRFRNPEELAYGRNGEPRKTLYRVRFDLIALWPDYDGNSSDTLDIELYEHWLDGVSDGENL